MSYIHYLLACYLLNTGRLLRRDKLHMYNLCCILCRPIDVTRTLIGNRRLDIYIYDARLPVFLEKQNQQLEMGKYLNIFDG